MCLKISEYSLKDNYTGRYFESKEKDEVLEIYNCLEQIFFRHIWLATS